MSSQWILGVHFEKDSSGKGFVCKRCGKKIASSPGLGPHLSRYYGKHQGEETPPQPEENEPLPTEEEALENMLKRFDKEKIIYSGGAFPC